MSAVYNHKTVEKKWQQIWQDEKAFAATNDYSKPKYYALVEFPYPSGQGLHVGHPRPYTALDIVARKRRMQGYNVLYPMGWDAFGLPTENYAIKNKIHPKIVTKNNIDHFKEQLQSIGYSFDWDREINTTDPDYYKWTQWIFLKLFKAGLAYKQEMPINWCTSCKVGLANEEVVNGVCERCGSPVVRKVKSEWMLKITDYADKLIEGLDHVDYIERVKTQQKNWIGRSTGAEVDFAIAGKEDKLRIYTTRCDTLFGVTYMVVSPEHPYLDKYKDEIKNWDEIESYREQASRKSDFERAELAKDKTGVEIDGLKAVNPVNLYGATKMVSDKLFIAANAYVGAKNTQFSVVRYGNVSGSRGSVIPFFKTLIDEGQTKIPITDMRMTRFWITLDEAVDLVIKAIGDAKGGELFIHKCPSFKVTDLAKAMLPDCEFEDVGIRPGEKLHEVMITKEDSRSAYEYDDYYIIYPDLEWWEDVNIKEGGKKVEDRFYYASDNNPVWLSVEEIREALKDIDIVY